MVLSYGASVVATTVCVAVFCFCKLSEFRTFFIHKVTWFFLPEFIVTAVKPFLGFSQACLSILRLIYVVNNLVDFSRVLVVQFSSKHSRTLSTV